MRQHGARRCRDRCASLGWSVRRPRRRRLDPRRIRGCHPRRRRKSERTLPSASGPRGVGGSSWPPSSGRDSRASTPPSSTSRCRRSASDLGADLAALQWTINGLHADPGLADPARRVARRPLRPAPRVRDRRRLVRRAPRCCARSRRRVELLIAARALQGVGGALLTPGSLAMIQASFRPQDRARAIGAWSGLGGVATAIGPLAGRLADRGRSRGGWIFLINLPLAVVVVLVGAAPRAGDPRPQRVRARSTSLGAVLGGVGLGGRHLRADRGAGPGLGPARRPRGG